MKDYIEREDALNALCKTCVDSAVCEKSDKDACHRIFTEIPAADVRENAWISVEDKLPEFDQRVLAFVKNKDPKNRFNPNGVYVAELKDKIPVQDPQGKKNFWGIPGYDSEWTVWAWSYFGEPCVTHWMPLPEPPEEIA